MGRGQAWRTGRRRRRQCTVRWERSEIIRRAGATHPQRLERLALLHEPVRFAERGVHLPLPQEAGRWRLHDDVYP